MSSLEGYIRFKDGWTTRLDSVLWLTGAYPQGLRKGILTYAHIVLSNTYLERSGRPKFKEGRE